MKGNVNRGGMWIRKMQVWRVTEVRARKEFRNSEWSMKDWKTEKGKRKENEGRGKPEEPRLNLCSAVYEILKCIPGADRFEKLLRGYTAGGSLKSARTKFRFRLALPFLFDGNPLSTVPLTFALLHFSAFIFNCSQLHHGSQHPLSTHSFNAT